MLRRWYAYAAFAFFVTVTFAGWIFFDRFNHELSINQWMYAWRSGSAYLNRFTPRDKDTAGGLN
jgi:hypothetical protein